MRCSHSVQMGVGEAQESKETLAAPAASVLMQPKVHLFKSAEDGPGFDGAVSCFGKIQ